MINYQSFFKVDGDNREYDYEFIGETQSNSKLIMKKLISKRPELMDSC